MKTKLKFRLVPAFQRRWALAAMTVFMLLSTLAWSQATLPFALTNNSTYADANVYVAVVGIINNNHSWIDCRTSAIHTMSTADNTVQGPVYGGDMGPGGNAKYANCFTRLSDIPNKTINMPAIGGCRILISFNSQLYMYFFGATGGYAAPNLSNTNDPNTGIRFEMIELTNGSNGLWANTTRVDSYQYPMGLEVWGNNSFYKKVGELKNHDQIIAQWQAQAPSEFQACLNTTQGIIKFPSKNPSFQQGGSSGNYFQSYIDAIWSKYTGGDLVFNAGDAGIWRGRVSGSAFNFTRSSDGAAATIPRKPTSQEAMEGSGALASGGQWDLVVQAQMCAAINRHALDLNIATGATQDWSNASMYYTLSPFNWYCKFWHQTDISLNGLTYAFCYDDVFDKSSTINAPSPTRALITIGGFAGQNQNTPQAIPGTIQAESYTAMAGIQTEATTDTGGGQNVGWIDAGDWMDYSVNVSSAGTHTVGFRVAAAAAGGQIQLRSGTTVLATANIPATGGWQTWMTVNVNANLSAGIQTLRAHVVAGGFNLNWIQFTTATTSSPIPGTIQAESFSAMSGVQTEATTDTGGGSNVGFIDTGDWMDYSVNVSSAGTYNVAFRVASLSGGAQVQLRSGTTVLSTTNIAATGGWQTWATVTTTANLSAGAQTLRIYFTTGGMNLNWVQFSTSSTAKAIPGTIQAESYNAMSGIQTEATTDAGGGSNVGFIDTGDWMDYNVNVASAGSYNVAFRVASLPGGAQAQLRSGTTVLATVNVAGTGGWQTWATVNTTANLTAGTQTLRVHFTAGGMNLNWIQFSSNNTTTNLALNKPVTVSSNQDAIAFPPAAAVDGNLGTRWSSAAADPQWIYVDLGGNYNINRVKLVWEAAYGKDYKIQVSGSTSGPWTDIKTVTGNTTLTNDWTGLSGTGKYVRMSGTARGTVYGYSLYEFEVYGTAAARMPDDIQTSNELAGKIQLYPNPVREKLTIAHRQSIDEFMQVNIYSLQGRLVKTIRIKNGDELNVADLPVGNYVLMLGEGKHRMMKMFIKE
jgi:hypothetical protein